VPALRRKGHFSEMEGLSSVGLRWWSGGSGQWRRWKGLPIPLGVGDDALRQEMPFGCHRLKRSSWTLSSGLSDDPCFVTLPLFFGVVLTVWCCSPCFAPKKVGLSSFAVCCSTFLVVPASPGPR